MREQAMNRYNSESAGRSRAAINARRFSPLCGLGYAICGQDGMGFTATDPTTGKTIRRLTFEAFDKAVRAAGMTRAARSELLEKRATPEYRLREQVNTQRLQLLAMERREVCPDNRQPRPKPIRTAATVRRLRVNNCGNVN